jgi:phosphonate transport system substrate-binding protein
MRCFSLIALVMVVLGAAPDFAAAQRSGWPAEVQFVLLPNDQSRVDRYQLLGAYLQGRVGAPFRIFAGVDYAAAIVALKTGRAHAGVLGPESYVIAIKEEAKIEPIVRFRDKVTGVGYHSLIIVRGDSPYRTLADLRGKNFAFVDPNSTSGYLIPRYHFAQQTIDPQTHFGRVIFAGDHGSAVLAVANGRVDAAAVADGLLARAEAGGQIRAGQVRVIWRSPLIPASPVVARTDLPVEFRQSLRQALLELRTYPRVMSAIDFSPTFDGFAAVTDADYEFVRQVDAYVRSPQARR